jgi:hypothetical protein
MYHNKHLIFYIVTDKSTKFTSQMCHEPATVNQHPPVHHKDEW